MAQSSVKLGSVGIWTRQFEDHPAAKVQEAAGELDELAYGAIWFGEAVGREALTHAGLLLAATRRIVIATGIANIYARDPVTMASGQKTLAEAYPDRFVLGLGVSHVPLVEQLRGHQYEKPVPRMRAYLDAMDQAPYRSVPPPSKPVRVLARFSVQADTCVRSKRLCSKRIRRKHERSGAISWRSISSCRTTPTTSYGLDSTKTISGMAAVTG